MEISPGGFLYYTPVSGILRITLGFAMERMPLEIQTLYSELMERLSALEARRSIGHVSGSFVTKAIKGDTYYYFQYSDPGGIKKQLYIGRKDRILDEVVKKYRQERGAFAEEEIGIQRLCSLVRTGGGYVDRHSFGPCPQSSM
jgi:hypothetical protein